MTECLPGAQRVVLGGPVLDLLPGRCAWLPAARTLLLADLHLGKAAAFRTAGIPVPEGNTQADLTELSRWISLTGAADVLICGDLFHAPAAQSPEVLEMVRRWRQEHAALTVRLVIGNHDRGRALPRPETGIEVCGESLEHAGLRFVHDPADAGEDGGWTVCGHLHPAVALPAGRTRPLRAPCFWLRESSRILVLPGFGSFTGGVPVHPAVDDRIFAVTGAAVQAVPVALLAGRNARGR